MGKNVENGRKNGTKDVRTRFAVLAERAPYLSAQKNAAGCRGYATVAKLIFALGS